MFTMTSLATAKTNTSKIVRKKRNSLGKFSQFLSIFTLL